MRSSGYSVIEVSLAVALLATLAMVIFKVADLAIQSQASSDLTFQADAIRRNVAAQVMNEVAWKKSLQDPFNAASFNCFNSPSCAGRGGLIKIRDVAGNLVYDSTNHANGFTTDGKTCTDFQEAIGNDLCPIRMEITWAPICDTPCFVPSQFKIKALLKYSPRSPERKFPINGEAYGFELVKNYRTH